MMTLLMEQTPTITLSVNDASSDDSFDHFQSTVSVNVLDDDTAGFTIAETEGSTGVDESGDTTR